MPYNIICRLKLVKHLIIIIINYWPFRIFMGCFKMGFFLRISENYAGTIVHLYWTNLTQTLVPKHFWKRFDRLFMSKFILVPLRRLRKLLQIFRQIGRGRGIVLSDGISFYIWIICVLPCLGLLCFGWEWF